MEADDLIAAITQNYNQEFIIISADHDLYQLLSPNVSMYSTKKKKVITEQVFIDEYRVTPEEWIMVKQIAGCTTDNVKGVPTIGEKRAIAFIKKTLRPDLKWYNRIKKNEAMIRQNETLVKLPFEGTVIPKLKSRETFYLANFIEITDEYGFRSMQQIEQLNQWIVNFGMV